MSETASGAKNRKPECVGSTPPGPVLPRDTVAQCLVASMQRLQMGLLVPRPQVRTGCRMLAVSGRAAFLHCEAPDLPWQGSAPTPPRRASVALQHAPISQVPVKAFVFTLPRLCVVCLLIGHEFLEESSLRDCGAGAWVWERLRVTHTCCGCSVSPS